MKEKGLFSSRLKQELDLIQVVTLDDDTFTWIKDQFTEILQGQNDWESRIEAALEECGVNVKLSDDGRFSFNPLSPHDALEYHFKCLNSYLIHHN